MSQSQSRMWKIFENKNIANCRMPAKKKTEFFKT